MTPREAEALASLLSERLAGAFAGRVSQPGAWALGIEVPGGRTLGFCWYPASLALGLCDWRWPRGVPGDILKSHLQSARIDAVSAVDGEPILRLHLRGDRALALVYEAIGRSANLLLLGEGDAILWSGRQLGGPFRSGEPGTQWLPPPPRDRLRPIPEEAFDAEGYLTGRGPREIREGLLERGRTAALSALVAKERALLRRREAVKGDLAEGEAWLRFEAVGQALLATGELHGRGEASRRVTLFGEGPPREEEVPLDPSLTVLENARALFRRAKKGSARQKAAAPILEGILRSLEGIPAERARVGSCDDLDVLYPAGRKVSAAPAPQARRSLPQGVASVPLPEGFAGYAGKSAEGNDFVSFRLGSGQDFWLHAEDYPGCHVVVKNPGRLETLPFQVEQAAALYAAVHSGAPPGNRVAVRLARCKNLRRVPRAPGRVMVSGARTVFVDLPTPGCYSF